MGNITMIASGKGGVGKSTISACLAASLSDLGKRVLLVDMDAGLGSLEHMLSIGESLVYDMSDIVKGNCTVMKAIYKCGLNDNLFLMPSPRKRNDALSGDILNRLFSVLTKYYDHILIDCPAGVGGGFLAAVECAKNALLVANPNPISLLGVQKVRDILIDNNTKQLRLVINRFDKRLFQKSNIYEDLDQVIDKAGVMLIGIIPEEAKAMLQLTNGKLPNKNSSASKAFLRLALRLEGESIPLPSLRKL